MLIDFFDERKLTVLDLDHLSWELRDMPEAVIDAIHPVLKRHGISVQVRCREDGLIDASPEQGQCIGLYCEMEDCICPKLKGHQSLMLGVSIAVDGKELINLSHDLTVDYCDFEQSVELLGRLLDHAIRVVSVKQLPYLW